VPEVVLEGFHAVKHALRFGAELERVCVVDRAAVADLAARLAPDVAAELLDRAEDVSAEAFRALAPRAARTGVAAVARRPPDRAPETLRRDAPVVFLEAPQDLGNLGACVRVAAAADAAGVVVSGEKDPWAPEALRGSAGLHFALPVLHAGAPPADRPLVAFDPAGAPFDPRATPPGATFAFGTERDGLSDALKTAADAVVALPMREKVSSLNLATSVSAALYALKLAR
jgi:TrmH family RNA methyltransferase